MAKIVKAKSKGYNYSYASLSDIANQGYEIPKMKTGTDALNLKDYVYYFDGQEWQRGAEIVLAQNKSMNDAQVYASSVTYARRLTTQLALGLATEEDKEVEQTQAPKQEKKTYCTKEQAEQVRKLLNQEQLNEMFKYYKINCVEALTVQQASAIIKKGATK